MNERKIPVNVIFIDIDGVLNCQTDVHDDSSRPYLNVELVRRFEEFCDLFEPLLVLTSSWREMRENADPTSVTGRLRSIEEVNGWFTSLKIPMRRIRDMTDPTTVSWSTEEEYASARAGEIQRWIIKKSEAYPDVCFNWIAFDDMRLPLPKAHFIHVADKTGLTVDSVNEGAKKLLSIIATGDTHQPRHLPGHTQ